MKNAVLYTLTAFTVHGSVDIDEAHGLAASDDKTNTKDKELHCGRILIAFGSKCIKTLQTEQSFQMKCCSLH